MSKTTGGIVIIIVGIVGYVTLLGIGTGAEDARGLLLFLGPIGAGLFVVDRIDDVRATANKIEKQTNGALTRKSDDIADAAIIRANRSNGFMNEDGTNDGR